MTASCLVYVQRTQHQLSEGDFQHLWNASAKDAHCVLSCWHKLNSKQASLLAFLICVFGKRLTLVCTICSLFQPKIFWVVQLYWPTPAPPHPFENSVYCVSVLCQPSKRLGLVGFSWTRWNYYAAATAPMPRIRLTSCKNGSTHTNASTSSTNASLVIMLV